MKPTKKIKKASFGDFLAVFPPVALPLTLSDQQHHDFSKENAPLSQSMIQQFILPYEDVKPSEFSEFVPCFSIPDTLHFHAVVFWRAELLKYDYILATFDQRGIQIDRRVISSRSSTGEELTQSVAIIEDDWMIQVIEGKTENQKSFDPLKSRIILLELLATGKIITI